jgi:inosine/xanthosine triphosphatase
LRGRVLVRVGSRNTAKLEAVRRGLAAFFTRVEVEAVDVASGVDAQPLGFAEIVAGARERARGAQRTGACDLAVGIEDGLVPIAETQSGWANIGACVLLDGRREAIGFSAGFEYPPACVRAASATPRTPIGDAFDALYRAPSGLADPGVSAGNIGRLSGGALTRADYGAQAVICAFVQLLHPDLYATDACAGERA